MTAIERTEGGTARRVISLIGLTLPVFAVTICLSALLLFSVQPMFAKMVLPLLLWLIGLFGVSIGLPFFAVTANAPLLQAWFARTRHPRQTIHTFCTARPISAPLSRCWPIRSRSSHS